MTRMEDSQAPSSEELYSIADHANYFKIINEQLA